MNRLLVAMVMAYSGCAGLPSESGTWNGSGGGSSFTTTYGDVHRGLAQLSRDTHLYFVLLTAGGEPTQVSSGRIASGRIKGADGREYSWVCDTRDGVSGELTVAGQKLRLENGGIVLVDMRRNKVIVRRPPGI